jgi:hypothetical protein
MARHTSTTCIAGGHSTKELSRQLINLSILSRYNAYIGKGPCVMLSPYLAPPPTLFCMGTAGYAERRKTQRGVRSVEIPVIIAEFEEGVGTK